jgi:hypothetical protein
MLPFFFLHYDKLVQRYIIYDDASTDNSRGILQLNPKVQLRPVSHGAIPTPDLIPCLRFRSDRFPGAMLSHVHQ